MRSLLQTISLRGHVGGRQRCGAATTMAPAVSLMKAGRGGCQKSSHLAGPVSLSAGPRRVGMCRDEGADGSCTAPSAGGVPPAGRIRYFPVDFLSSPQTTCSPWPETVVPAMMWAWPRFDGREVLQRVVRVLGLMAGLAAVVDTVAIAHVCLGCRAGLSGAPTNHRPGLVLRSRLPRPCPRRDTRALMSWSTRRKPAPHLITCWDSLGGADPARRPYVTQPLTTSSSSPSTWGQTDSADGTHASPPACGFHKGLTPGSRAQSLPSAKQQTSPIRFSTVNYPISCAPTSPSSLLLLICRYTALTVVCQPVGAWLLSALSISAVPSMSTPPLYIAPHRA